MNIPSKNDPQTSHPVPTRFFQHEAEFLADVSKQTGLPVSEIIRRSVRLMKRQKEILRGYGFIIELVA